MQMAFGSTTSIGEAATLNQWSFYMAAPATVTLTANAEPTLLFGIVNEACTAFLISDVTGGNCDESSVSMLLGAGTYSAFAAYSTFTGLPCGENNDYWIRLDVDPEVACEFVPPDDYCPVRSAGAAFAARARKRPRPRVRSARLSW